MITAMSPESPKQVRGLGQRPSWIGAGSVGGKAQGLVSIQDALESVFGGRNENGFEIIIPPFCVVRTDVFDSFLSHNHLQELALSCAPDDEIALAFQRASMPTEILGELRALVEYNRTPLAIRSSSMLEDALYQPFAGVYATKMIPNNFPSSDERFQKLMEAIKLVYSSTFMRSAQDYILATGKKPGEEKMAVIIQEVFGKRHADRFYPEVSGVARSYNFYSFGRARPSDGVVSLALGLGRTIVEGEKCWTYSPAYPQISPPFGSPNEALKQTQTEFWAVNMGKPPAYDPIRETEYLVHLSLQEAEYDETLQHIVSTYSIEQDRIVPGLNAAGPRILNFFGPLQLAEPPLNGVLRLLLRSSEKAVGAPVEIEFAATFNPPRLAFLQVRPMVVSDEEVSITDKDMERSDLLVASENALGNGIAKSVKDVVYVRPERFDPKYTRQIALELEKINRVLLDRGHPYLLIGFGRWGSRDPWLGIPVNWGQICGAKVIVEATLPTMNIDVSQGSHFFHNLTSFRVSYLCAPFSGEHSIRWSLLDAQQCEHETEFIRHIALRSPLIAKVDGRTGRGIITIETES